MHELKVNVRFSETDALGHINNTSYFIYLEEARMKFFEALGLATNVEEWNFCLLPQNAILFLRGTLTSF